MTPHWTDRLSAYLDDELAAGDRAACEAHLRACDACRIGLAELQEVIEAARRAPTHAPADDLWPAIAARLSNAVQEVPQAPGADSLVHPVVVPWRSRRVSFSLPSLALAASLLVAVSAGVSWLAAHREATPGAAASEPAVQAVSEPFAPVSNAGQVTFADAQYDAAISDLERLLADHRDALDPRTVRVLERNLQTIDLAIQQARAALDSDPANPFLNSHLVDARQRKLDLLRRAALIAEGGGD